MKAPLILAALLVATHCSAQARSAEEEAEWSKIRAMKSAYEEAAKTGDWEKFAPNLASGFTILTATGDSAASLEEWKRIDRAVREQIGPGGTYSVSVSYEPGTMVGDTAVGYGTTNETIVTSEKTRYDFRSYWTAVLRKENGAWRLFRLHVSMDPLNNVFVRTFRLRTAQGYALAGVAAGTLFGFLLRGLIARRRR